MDDELRHIREARMRELQKSNGASANEDQQEDMIAGVLAQLLDQPARERLNRVRIVKPERAAQVEKMLVIMAQTGQLSTI